MSTTEATLLEELPLFRFMPPEVRELVAASFVPASYGFGDVIVREGDDADALFVVVSGRVRVVKTADDGQEVVLKVLERGASFGETGLLERTRREATVRASSEVSVLRLDAAVFAGLVSTNPEVKEFLELQVTRRRLENFFRLHSEFAELPPDTIDALLRELEGVDVAAGATVIRQGEEPGPMFVVQEGRLRARVDGRDVAYYSRGDFFGERSLFAREPRAATVEAVSECRLLRLAPDGFARLLEGHPELASLVGRRVEQYRYQQTANVPLDFAEELLPSEVAAPPPVSEDQAEQVVDEPADEAHKPDPAAAGPFATPDGRFVKRRGRIRRFQHLYQVDEMDCGAACLAMVCRSFGRAVSLARVRQLVRTGIDGTSLLGITRGAEALGLAARSIKVSKRNLDRLPLPAIVHWDANHWVVLYDVGERHVRYADPAVGLRRISRAEFEAKWTGFTVLLEPTPAFEEAPVGGADFSWLRRFFARHRRALVAATAIALGVSALQLALPVFMQVVVDRVVPGHDIGLLRVMLLGMGGVIAAMLVGSLAHRYILSRVAVRIDSDAMDLVSQKMLALPMRYFYARRAGDIQRRLAGMQQARMFVVQHGVVALTAVAQLVAATVLMFVYQPLLALLFLAAGPIYAALVRFAARRLRPVFDTLEESFGRYSSRQIDAIKGIEAVKAMGAEDALRRELLTEFQALTGRLFRADFTEMLYQGGVQLVAFASLVVFVWVGSLQVLKGSMSIGELVSFNALLVLANAPIVLLLTLWDQLQFVRVLMTRLSDVFEEEPEQGRDRSHLRPVPTLSGGVQVENVGFRFAGPESPSILDGVSFEVRPGTTVAIVGRSGSGKTTLVKCLAGLHEPTAGTIRYDGVDMSTLDYRQLRRRIGFVLQESFLFADTIARNIAFGDDHPDMQQVEWAAHLANAHEFIERLPLGYETKVGETGLLLSGGQRQRVAIARAIYHRPPVLIFDEATSSLDAESEQAVQENLDRLLEGRTSFVIAHRISTIRGADVILVIDRGRLVEQGTHDELIARKGLYFYLSSRQLDL
ncbi:MAG: peptidase domain-containing ABC transporter [Actinomycetota bacterium]